MKSKPKRKIDKLYNPAIAPEVAKLFFVRNFAPIENTESDYTFEMTNGLGFDKVCITAFIMYVGKAKLPIVTTAITYPIELLDSEYLNKIAQELGISVSTRDGKTILVAKLSMKNENSFTILRLYDFINHLYLLADMKETYTKEKHV